jgi:hypothetical protein
MVDDKSTDKQDDLEFHPWLVNYRKKNEIEKVEILTDAVKQIENNLGFVSILSLINSILIIGLIFGALLTGVVSVGSELSNSLIGLAKNKIGIGGEK